VVKNIEILRQRERERETDKIERERKKRQEIHNKSYASLGTHITKILV
jgi:hypothetical protein